MRMHARLAFQLKIGFVATAMATAVALADSRAAAQAPAQGAAQSSSQIDGYRGMFGRHVLSIGPNVRAKDGKYDLVVHFHGVCQAQEGNAERAQLNAVIVSVNLGVGSGPYEDAFRDTGSFASLLRAAQAAVEKSGRLPGATPGRVAISSWSAGFGAVSAILKVPENAERIDAVILADGLHTSYLDEKRHVLNDAPLAKYVRVAEAAMRGDKLFAITHSSIPTAGYPSATETVHELLKLTGLPKSATSIMVGARNMKEIYESHLGSFHVKGFEGTQAKDHVDQIHSMGDTVFPYLRDRWSR
jgi:hypothetical protein